MQRELSCAIYGKSPDVFTMIPLPFTDDPELTALSLDYAESEGMRYAGTMTFRSGKCHAECEKSWDSVSVMMSAAVPFARFVAARIPRADLLEMYRPQLWSELT